MTTKEMQESIQSVPIGKIIVRSNYRETDPSVVNSLAASFLDQGQLCPVGIVKITDGYKLVWGENRLDAAIQIGWSTILAKVFESLSEVDEIALRLQDNLLRADNDPIETAFECDRLRRAMKGTDKEAAKRIGISPGFFSRLVKRLSADDHLITLAREKKIPCRAIDALLLVRDQAKREAILAIAVDQKLSADRIDQLCKEARDPKATARKIAFKLPCGVAVSLVIPSSAKVPDIVSALDGMTKEIRRCAGQRPETRDFLTQLSLNLSARGG